MQSTERKHFFSQIILLKYLQAVCVRTWLNPSPALSLEFLNKKIAYQYCELTLSFLKYSNTTKKKTQEVKM